MIRRTAILTALMAAALCGARSADAQEFRIYTQIYDLSQESPVVAARTLALFHAGKVYDHIDKVGEVVIFEPMQSRFTILNTRRALATEIHFDEIRRLLKSARQVAEKRLKQLENQNPQAADQLRFQLEPKFYKQFDDKEKKLTLLSPYLRYDVTLKPVETKEIAEAYRQYADWTNRLNFVLHPRRLLPGPRLELNRQLRGRQSIPVDVVLRAGQQNPIHLRAEHRIHWKLASYDRTRLTEWKALLNAPDTRKVTFREYLKAGR